MADGGALNIALELVVHQAAQEHGANANALLDSKQFVTGLQALEPGIVGFRERVSRAVAAAAETDERFRAPAAQGGAAGTPPPEQWTRDQVKAASPAEVVAAGDAGLLRDLGYGPRRRRGAA